MDELAQRLEDAIARRDKVLAEKQRLQGKLESAQQAQQEVEAEIKAKKIDPEKIDDAIEQLKTSYESLVDQIEQEIGEAEEAIAPFLKE